MIIHKALKVVVLLLLVEMFDCLPKARVPTKVISKVRSCECSLFLKEDLWLPKFQVMALTNDYKVDCTDLGGAAEKCKTYCADEVAALNSLYENDPSVLRDYPPSQSIPCHHSPTDTVSFAKICGSQSYVLTSTLFGPPICCDASSKRIWCGSTSSTGWFGSFSDSNSITHNIAEGRKLNLQKDENDESHNEIDDSSDSDSKPGKKKQGTPYIAPGSKSWMYTVLKYFGYSTFSDLVKGVDIFSLPVEIQAAVRTYKDEVSLGRCYMEFTTFKVFTKQESPFEGLLRRKRSSTYDGPITRFDEYVGPEGNSSEGFGKMMPFDGDTIKNLMNGVAGMLQRSDNTKQYADMLTSFLPIVTQLVTGGNVDTAPSPVSLLLKFAGPLLSRMSSARPSSNSIHDAVTKVPQKQSWPNAGPSSAAASSPFSSMAMSMIGNIISNFFGSPGAQNKIETPAPISTRPTKPSTTPAPSVDTASSGIRTLLKLFLQGAAGSTPPVARPIETPKPSVENIIEKDSTLNPSEREEKRFLHMLLQVIRPIFISIVGNTPGENGVKEIRKMSTLSTMGRVDDTLREAVDSPFFCFKKYLVNKAWSITENGVRSVVSTFTPEEQARMMKSIATPKY